MRVRPDYRSLGACVDLHPVYRRLPQMALADLGRLETQLHQREHEIADLGKTSRASLMPSPCWRGKVSGTRPSSPGESIANAEPADTSRERHFVRETLRCHAVRADLVNAHHERRLGIRTTRGVRISELGIVSADSIDSMPLGYEAFFSALERVPANPSTSVFLDYGAGKGRAVCAASTFPFRRVIGVDFSNVLLEVARENVARMKHRRAEDVELVHSDATTFDISPDVNLIYFYNPFFGDTLRRVVDNIRSSHERHTRKIDVIFFNNDHFDEIVGEGWLTKTHQSQFYPDVSCGVYETHD